jgi:hypothetical protein
MRDREIDLQQPGIADLARIVGDLHRFGMSGAAGADRPVLRRRPLAAGIAGDGVADALDMLEDALDTPEAAAGDDGDLRAGTLRGWLVECGRGDDAPFLCGGG